MVAALTCHAISTINPIIGNIDPQQMMLTYGRIKNEKYEMATGLFNNVRYYHGQIINCRTVGRIF